MSNQRFNVWHASDCTCACAKRRLHPICASNKSNLLPLFPFETQPLAWLLCFKNPRGFHRQLLPGYLETSGVLSFPSTSTHFSSLPQQEGEGKQKSPLPVGIWPAFYTMEQEVAGSCEGGHGLWREDKAFPPSDPTLILLHDFPSPYQSELGPRLLFCSLRPSLTWRSTLGFFCLCRFSSAPDLVFLDTFVQHISLSCVRSPCSAADFMLTCASEGQSWTAGYSGVALWVPLKHLLVRLNAGGWLFCSEIL